LGIPLFGFLLAGVGDQLGTIFGKGIAKVEDTFVVSMLTTSFVLHAARCSEVTKSNERSEKQGIAHHYNQMSSKRYEELCKV